MNNLRYLDINGPLSVTGSAYIKGSITWGGSATINYSAIMQAKTATQYNINPGGGSVYCASTNIYISGNSFYYKGYSVLTSNVTNWLKLQTNNYGTPAASTVLYGLAIEASSPTTDRRYITDTIRLPVTNTSFYYSGGNLYHTVPSGPDAGVVRKILSCMSSYTGSCGLVSSSGATTEGCIPINPMDEATFLTFWAKANTTTGSHYISVDDINGTADPANKTDTMKRIYVTATRWASDIIGGGIIIPQNEQFYVHVSRVQWYIIKRTRFYT